MDWIMLLTLWFVFLLLELKYSIIKKYSIQIYKSATLKIMK